MLKDSILPPPALPQMANDGYITETELSSDGGIVVNVQHYTYTHAADFDVTDTVVESVTFTLSLPDTGDYVQGSLVFSDDL